MLPIASLGLIVASAYLGWVPRDHINLNGPWQRAVAPQSPKAPPQSGWQSVEVPNTFSSVNYGHGWYRRKFTAPARWAGKRVKLILQGAKYCPEVFINGKPCGQHFGGYEPSVFDITAAVRPGRENEILVHVYDWTILFRGPPLKIPKRIDWHSLRALPRDRVIYPIGGRFNLAGLWDDVLAYAVPEVYASDAFIITDVAHRKLTVLYTVVNEGRRAADALLRPRVEQSGRTVMRLPAKPVRVPAGGKVSVAITAEWKDGQVELWTPERPRLYVLVTELRSPAGADVRRDRFGFRQFTIMGPDFYLNGVKRHLLATASWPLPARTRDEIAQVLRAFKQANCNAFRTHTQPWRQIWYDVADEVGLMMIPEGAVWNDDTTYRLDDPQFWDNWGQHLRGMVRALRNHPSVVMWSLENEFHGSRARTGSIYEKRLADLGRLVKREDPTRPITYESDGDPGGAADVIGLHYPHEPPAARLWPQEAYWMDKGTTRGVGMFWPKPQFRWDKRKPLYIGEYLWWPGRSPESYTLIVGDEAYRDLNWARGVAKAAVWRWQTIAYRHYGVSGICPWTMVEGGPLDLNRNPLAAAQAYAMQPVAAYVREELRRFYAGAKASLHLEIFNDLPQPLRATLRWALVAGGRALAQGGMGLNMQPAGHWDRALEFVAPQVHRPTACSLRVEIVADGRKLFSDERPLTVYPKARLRAAGQKIYVYDPSGETARLLREQGVELQPVAALDKLPRPPAVLVVGERAFSDGMDRWAAYTAARALVDFARAGGAAVVLQQTSPAAAVLPGGLLPAARSTIGFILRDDHPLTEGLPDDAFKFWAPDHTVSAAEMPRLPGGTVALVVTGTAHGISRCLLAEARRGRGVLLRCQLPVVERFAVEPMAAVVLQRLLDYASAATTDAKPVRPAVVVGADGQYRDSLGALGVAWAPGELSARALASGRVVICRGDTKLASSPQAIADALRAGGVLVLDRPPARLVERLSRAIGLQLTVEPYSGPALRSDGDGRLVQAIAREDLYWLGEPPPGPSWLGQPLAEDVATGALAIAGRLQPLVTIRPQDMKLSEGRIYKEEGTVAMYSSSEATAKFSAPRAGMYAVGVEARGTAAAGVFAAALVYVDGKPIGYISTTANWRMRALPAKLAAGEHSLAVRFINDYYAPPEDRNMWLRKVVVAPANPQLARLQQIAVGMTLVAIPVGRGMMVVNLLKWDAAGKRNAEKAERMWSSLLAALGVDFRDRLAVTYDLSAFRPDPQMPHYSTSRGYAYLRSAGYIEGQIQVPADGYYVLMVEASGEAAAGELPVVAVNVDGEAVAQIKLTREDWKLYPVRVQLAAGKHRVRLAFTNDYYKPPEDRNLALRRLLVAPAAR